MPNLWFSQFGGIAMDKPSNLRVETAYLQISPFDSDGGELIGRDPREIPLADIFALGHAQTQAAAIRAHCIQCSGGSEAEARKCVAKTCNLWEYRKGVNPYRSKTRKSDERKSELQEMARAARAAKGSS